MLASSTHLHCYTQVKMEEDKDLDIAGLPEDPSAQGKSSNANVEAAFDELEIERVESVYR